MLWIALVAGLMVTDVWDETLGITTFLANYPSSPEEFLMQRSTRPLPVIAYGVFFRFLHDYDTAWRFLRALNAVFLLGALGLMFATVRRLKPLTAPRQLFLLGAFLFSGASIITAGWYANVYDASALILVWTGVFLLAATDYEILPAVVFGLAFFCKETAVLLFPFVLGLALTNLLDRRRSFLVLGLSSAFFLVYLIYRQKVVALGGSGDIHGFSEADFFPSVVGWFESFWWQDLNRPGPGLAGFLFTGFSLVALRNIRLALVMLATLLLCPVIYCGMTDAYETDLLGALHFIGRLYLIPFSFFLFLLAFDARRWALPVLLIPILFGAFHTARSHYQFQQSFAAVYERARQRPADRPLTVKYSPFPGPLIDTRRHLVIGRIPKAEYRLHVKDGTLLKIAEAAAP
ncbi:MAG: hypothetical protein V1929_11235 [bacterium]